MKKAHLLIFLLTFVYVLFCCTKVALATIRRGPRTRICCAVDTDSSRKGFNTWRPLQYWDGSIHWTRSQINLVNNHRKNKTKSSIYTIFRLPCTLLGWFEQRPNLQ